MKSSKLNHCNRKVRRGREEILHTPNPSKWRPFRAKRQPLKVTVKHIRSINYGAKNPMQESPHTSRTEGTELRSQLTATSAQTFQHCAKSSGQYPSCGSKGRSHWVRSIIPASILNTNRNLIDTQCISMYSMDIPVFTP